MFVLFVFTGRDELFLGRDLSKCFELVILNLFCFVKYVSSLFLCINYPADTQRPENVSLWSYFDRDFPDHNLTKIERIRFLTYIGSAMSDLHLASRNTGKFA